MFGIEAIGTYLGEVKNSNYSRLKEFNLDKEFIENKSGFRYLRKALEGEKNIRFVFEGF